MVTPKKTRPIVPKAGRKKIKKRPVTAEDLLSLQYIKGGVISPGGDGYAFAVQQSQSDHKGYRSHLYTLNPATSVLRRFSWGKKSDASPVYSPDGSLLAFTSKRGEEPGIHLIPTDGGEARCLIEKDGFFSDLSFSPNGRQLMCLFQPSDPKPDKDGKKTKNEPPLYRHIDRLFYRLDGAGFLPKAPAQIWLFDIESGEGTQLTRMKEGAGNPVFSPDGRKIAFVSNIQRDPDLDIEHTDLFVISAKGGKPKPIATPPGPVELPSFSPDGKWLAYLGHDDLKSPWYEQVRVWVVPSGGRGAARCLCPGFDQPAYDSTITDSAAGQSTPRPHWSRDGRSIYFLSSGHGGSALYRVPFGGGKPVSLTPDRIHLQACAISTDCRFAIGVVSTATEPVELYRFDLRARTNKRLTGLNRDWCSPLDLQRPKHVRIKSTEKTVIDGWIMTPPNFKPRKKYPAIVEIHGGPMTQYGYSFFHEMQLLAAKGYVVFYSNPRGSQGYGRAFAEAIRGDWGNRDWADVQAGTDYLADLPFVDEKRIGITGGSYGGYMTNWAVGHTRRYKAAVTQRSVVDLAPFFGSSDVGYLFKETFDAYPWEDLEGYRRQSPLTYVKNIRTPLLIIHSESDLRCNIEQAENLFATLKVLKRKVEMVRFPGEPHGLSRGGRPDRRVARLEKILDWFERYL
jgi:dipeptidyl aminopeptidase/acylaminoacyl peptidase